MATPIAVSTLVWIFIVLPIVVIWAIGLVDIIRRPLSGGRKAGWILLVVVLPVVGTLLYFVLRKPTDEEVRLHQAASSAARSDRWGGTGPRPPVE